MILDDLECIITIFNDKLKHEECLENILCNFVKWWSSNVRKESASQPSPLLSEEGFKFIELYYLYDNRMACTLACSTSPPGGNLVDGLPPVAHTDEECIGQPTRPYKWLVEQALYGVLEE